MIFKKIFEGRSSFSYMAGRQPPVTTNVLKRGNSQEGQ